MDMWIHYRGYTVGGQEGPISDSDRCDGLMFVDMATRKKAN